MPHLQNGSIYLTTHRACYVDAAEPRRHSAAVHLRDVARYEYYVRLCPPPSRIERESSLLTDRARARPTTHQQAGFLRSSPKITLYPHTDPLAPAGSSSSAAPSRTEA